MIGHHELLDFVQSIVPDMRVTRPRNLALTVLGIVQVRDGHLTVWEIARTIPGRIAHWHKFKRIKQFLSNLKWTPEDHFADILRLTLHRFRVNDEVPIIIDQSTRLLLSVSLLSAPGIRKFVCKDPISAAWMALRLLEMPWFLKPRVVNRALLLCCWKLSFKTG